MSIQQMDVPAQPPEGMKKPVPGKVDPGPAELMDCTVWVRTRSLYCYLSGIATRQRAEPTAQKARRAFSPLCGYFPHRSRWKPTEGTAGRKAGQIGMWYMYQSPFSNRCRTASAQYLFRDTPAAAAASRSSSFFPFGTRTMIESTFSDRYFSFAFALAGVFPLYFPMVIFYHTNHRTTTDNHRTTTDG